MYCSHGTLARDGQSLDGYAYNGGDPVAIFDDGRNEACKSSIHVLNLQSGRSMLVSLTAVCWTPAFAEQRPTEMVLFTLYGRRFDLQQPGDTGTSWGSQAIRVSLGTNLVVSHKVIAGEDLATWAQQLDLPAQQAFFTLQWNIIASGRNDQCVDNCSDSGVSSGLSSPSLTSPASPAPKAGRWGVLRRDSAIDLGCQQPEHGKPLDDLRLDMPPIHSQVPHAGVSVPSSPRWHVAVSSDAFLESHQQGATAKDLPMTPPDNKDPFFVRPVAHTTSHSAHASYDGRAKEPSALDHPDASGFHVNDVYVSSDARNGHPTQRNTQSSFAGSASRPSAPRNAPSSGHEWQLSPHSGAGYRLRPQSQGTYYVNQSTGVGTPQDFVPSTSLGSSQVQKDSQLAEHDRYGPLDGQELDCRQGNGGTVPHTPVAHSALTFFRTQETHTMDLTAPTTQSAPVTHIEIQGHQPNAMCPPAETVPETPEKPVKSFRPDLIADLFRHQTRPHMEVLQARRQQDHPSATATGDHTAASPPSLASEALRLIQKATTDTLKTLDRLCPGATDGYERTEQRLRQEVDPIIAAVQSVRQSALRETEILIQESQRLTQAVTKLERFVDYLGDVRSDMVVRAAERRRDAAAGAAVDAPGPAQSSTSRSVTDMSHWMAPSRDAFQWAGGQAIHNSYSGVPVRAEHQRPAHELAGIMNTSQPMATPGPTAAASSNTALHGSNLAAHNLGLDSQSLSPAPSLASMAMEQPPAATTTANTNPSVVVWGPNYSAPAAQAPSFGAAFQPPLTPTLPGPSAHTSLYQPAPSSMAAPGGMLLTAFPHTPEAALPSNVPSAEPFVQRFSSSPMMPPFDDSGAPPMRASPTFVGCGAGTGTGTGTASGFHQALSPRSSINPSTASVPMVPSVSAPGAVRTAQTTPTAASDAVPPAIWPPPRDRTRSLPVNRRLNNRERERDRAAPYSRIRKGSS